MDCKNESAALASDHFNDSDSFRWNRWTQVGGGSISEAYRVELAPRRELFVKINDSRFLTAFESERSGLQSLRAFGKIRVPEPIAVECVGQQSMFVCEAITTGHPSRKFFERFGRQLADLHRASAGNGRTTRFGYDHDNYLGAATQLNAWHDDWATFFVERRLGPQIAWGERQGLLSGDLLDMLRLLLERVRRVLRTTPEPPTLIHGDLWSGNYLCDQEDQPVLVDPACYWGHREAEFGMLTWMGGCPDAFYDAYVGSWPFADGWRQRVTVYRLYHQLNHLNLFGGGYRSACRQTTKEILEVA
ncbi:MAG: fructosamine kinase family protein [Pirellulaceae bacterium]